MSDNKTQIQQIGEHYTEFLDGLLNEFDNDVARAEFLKMTLDGVLRQYVRRKGFSDTASLLRFVADHLDSEGRKCQH